MTLGSALDAQLKRLLGVDVALLKFLARQRLLGFDVPASPHFDSDETTAWFASRLASSKKYLEYGTGGSTLLAAKIGVDFIAVDSDPYFLKCVREKIRKEGFAKINGQTYCYANIGVTGFWGYPVRPWRASRRRLEQFRRYSDPPSQCFEGGRLPDLVLIDGRFRVACALKAVQMLQKERGWAIVVDDYRTRPKYAVIAEFAELDRYVGRVAVFDAPKSVDQARLESAIRHYETIPD